MSLPLVLCVYVLDITTRGGDVLICVIRRAQCAGLQISWAGADGSPTALAHAKGFAVQIALYRILRAG
jgi:hypothetical protein